MKQASIFQQLAWFTVGVVVAAMSLSFAVTYWVPPPEPGRMNIDEAAHALRDLPSSVIDLHASPEPPDGQRSDLIEAALSKELGVSKADVRAVWRGLPGSVAGPGQAVVLIDGRDVLVEGKAGGFTMRSGEGAALQTSTFVPLFEAALRLPDESWRIGVPRDPLRQAWRTRIILTYAMGILLLTPLAWAVARRIARPVVRLGLAAGTAAPTVLNPFPVEGPRELRLTAHAMNAMHGRLREHSSEQIRIYAALAHDLRTPLTALRLRAEEVDEPLRSRLVGDLERMTQMAAELLERTELAAMRRRLELVDLAALITAWCTDRKEAGDPVKFRPSKPIKVETDPVLLRRAVDNLIDNAVRYGGAATVSITRDHGSVTIAIDDPGPGIPSHLLDHMTKPFVRLELSRNRDQKLGGTGLGLSIVKDIAGILGGRLSFATTETGFSAHLLVAELGATAPDVNKSDRKGLE